METTSSSSKMLQYASGSVLRPRIHILRLRSLPPSPYVANTFPSSMSSTVIPSSNFKVIFDAALANYHEHTGVDLSQYPFAEKLQNCQSADVLLELLQEKAKEFKDFRNGNHKLINCLRPVVQVLHAFSGVLNDVARLHLSTSDHFLTSRVQVPFQPTNLIFYGVDLLLCVCIFLTFFDYILIRVMSTVSDRYCSWDKL
jgi:hypothetical protein